MVQQKCYKVSDIAKVSGFSRKTIYQKINKSLDYGGNGIINFGKRSFFVVKTKTTHLFYECLIPSLHTLKDEYLCRECEEKLGIFIKNAT